MLKLTITQRALILFVIISVVPVLVLNTYWLRSQQEVLRQEVEREQQVRANFAAERTNNFLTHKVSAMILHSQSAAVLSNNKQTASFELVNYSKQDQDIVRLMLLDKNETAAVDVFKDDPRWQALKDGLLTASNQRAAEAFKVVTFLGGKEYISPVFYVADKPFILIAVPSLTFTGDQNFNNLSTSEPGVVRSASEINGALVTVVDLESTLHSILSNDDSELLSYITNERKQLVAHEDDNLSKLSQTLDDKPAVSYFAGIKEPKPALTATGFYDDEQVLAVAAPIAATGWTYINEVPISTITKSASQVSDRVLYMNILIAAAALVTAYIFSSRITKPITALARDAEVIGSGNFDQPIATIRRYDEIGSLSRSLFAMGQRLKGMVGRISGERDQLDFVLNSVSEGIFVLDHTGNIKLANKAALKIYDVTLEQLIGKPFKDITTYKQDVAQITVNPDDIDPKDKLVEYRELMFTDSYGKNRYVDIVLAKLDNQENDIGSIATVMDMTAQRELEAMKVDFVSLAAHELRTPLTAIRGYLELTLNDTKPALEEKHRKFLLQANDSSLQLVSLINNLLNVSKIERNALKVSMEKLDLAQMVSSSAQNGQFSAEKSKISLSYEGPENGAYVIGDSVAIREVIDNFIANALHYTPENGQVKASVEVTPQEIIVRVNDTGIGISEENQQKLFTKFYRVHSGLATGSGGSGLGLYISKSIIELHNGRIWVESKEGFGSTFSFAIPVYNEDKMISYNANTDKDNTVRRHRGWITKNSNN